MIKNFNDNIILTSQNREAILVVKRESYDGFVSPSYDINNLDASSFFINGVDMSKLDVSTFRLKTCVKLTSTIPAVFHVVSKNSNDFDINLNFTLYDSSLCNNTVAESAIDVSVLNRPFKIDSKNFNLYNNDKIIVDNESSYLILRTNPKFSGNIKLVVDSSDNLYLDTFKVSAILSNKKYRKQQVSANSVFSSDIRKTFDSIPSGEIFKVEKENTLDISLPKTSLDKQYSTIYNYGARLLKDDLYVEDYSILAPIWINSTIPDFFVVFRLDGAYNPEMYKETVEDKISNLATKYIKNSNLIKSWSLNQKNNLGKYLYTHLNELKKIQSPVYLPLTEYDHNVWNGISIKSGIISSCQETSYQFGKIVDNFTDMNAFISNGFERNNILCPNLINLEYAFNDESADMYSMHRYFGLYLSENILYKISYYKNSEESNEFNILSLDGKDVSTFIKKDSTSSNSIFSLSGSIHDEFKNRIFAINNNNNLTRLTSSNQLNDISYINDYCNKPGENIFTSSIVNRNISQFITININNKMMQGDHLRVINKTKNIIWEIYGIDIEPINAGEPYKYCSSYSTSGYPDVYRNAYSILGEYSDQNKSICGAFNMFNEFDISTNFSVIKNSDNSFSILIDNDCDDLFSFQHITSQQKISNDYFSNENNPTYLDFFGHKNASSLYNTISFDASLGPINFEYHGDRKNVIIDFVKTNNVLSSLISNVTDKFQPYMYYKNYNGWNKLIQSFDISVNSNTFTYQYITDPYSDNNEYLISTEDAISTIEGKLYAYSVMPLNISLMSINSVKDFDFTVYDKDFNGGKSEYFYNRADDNLTYSKKISKITTINDRNSYLVTNGAGTITIGDSLPINYAVSNGSNPFEFNTFFGSATISPSSITNISYSILDGSYNFVGYNSAYSEDDVSSYYINNELLKYSLTAPHVTQWVMQGLDCRNNEMRLRLDSSNNGPFNLGPNDTSVSTNFIPTLDNSIFSNEISTPIFKYISSDNESWKKYVYYDINDSIFDISTNKYTSIKEAIINNPYIDIFSKMIYSNNESTDAINRSSIMSYNKYKNSIDTIYSGLKLSISSNKNSIELGSIENYNRYKFAFVSTSSRNYSNNSAIEVIINENTKTILMVWYQGNDILNYYYRNSTYNIGKSILSDNLDKRFSSFYYGKDASINSIKTGFAKAPFFLKTDTVSIYAKSVNPVKINYLVNESSPLVQFSQNKLNNRGNIFVAYSDSSIKLNYFSPIDKTYDNFNGVFQYNYVGNKSTGGINIINHANVYDSNKNLYADTINITLLNNLLKENDIFYTVIRQNKVYNNATFGYKSFNISLNNPKYYKNKLGNHNGGFFPKFNNMLNFSNNENSTIIDIVEKDFISSNTNLISYKNVSQLWNNKIFYNISQNDIDNRNSIQCEPNYNIFKSLWDKSFYTAITLDSSIRKIDGYESSIELPTFFGSKLIKLPHTIKITNWDNLSSNISFLNNDIILKFNLSLSIRKIFKNEPTFLSNWSKLQSSSQFIDQYINDTILSYYSINLPSLGIKLFSKNNGILSILENYESDMQEVSNQNFHSELIYEKEEYFYIINIKNSYNNISYYAEITLNQK